MADFTSIEEMAKALCGEWKSRKNFIWTGCADPDADRCALIPLRNRDNAWGFDIRRAMAPFIENGTAGVARMRHWAVGWQEELWLHVYDETGEITPGFKKLWKLYQHKLSLRSSE